MSEDLDLLREENFRLRIALDSGPRFAPGWDTDILANIGHELRTPLTIIQGLSELLLDAEEPMESRDFLLQIHRASLSLGKLVETSIVLTKLNTGFLEIQPQPLNLTEAIEQVVRQFQDDLAAKDICVSLEFSADTPLIMADGTCMELVLQALIDNAIKFNKTGGKVHCSTRREANRVHVLLTDTGVGISADKLPALFEVFGQAESGMTRRFRGLGLGLPLVKRLLGTMDGSIAIESLGKDRGSTVKLVLPAVME